MASLFKKKIDRNMTIRAEHLIDEMLLLIKTVNSTLDDGEFEKCFIRLKAIFEELCLYEPYVDFTASPKKELRALNRKKHSAHKELLKRQKQFKNSTSSKMPRFDNSYSDTFDTDSKPEPYKNILGKFETSSKEDFEAFMWQCNKIAEAQDLKEIRNAQSISSSLYEQPNVKTEHLPQTEHSFKSLDIDNMDGHEFEEYCAGILERNGFVNVEVTQGSGDHGIDILAEKDDVSYAIQCKCYSGNIGNTAIQQALAGKKYYKRDIAVVLTNQYFTSQAKDEAKVFGVKLWDRDKLNDLIEKSNL